MPSRLLVVVCLALVLAVPASAASPSGTGATPTAQPAAGPGGLRGFLLRPDEPVTDTFARTPSFAWTPVRGTLQYQFELATSSGFQDNTIVWSSQTTSPFVSVPLSLPWMTGSPYALYAHVRAVAQSGVTAWSNAFGFNMRWKVLPTELSPSAPGLVRWTAVEGATSYDVWFQSTAGTKTVSTISNVADEREYYTYFAPPPGWNGTVQWRVRAVRVLYGPALSNGVPAVSHGPWSSTFTSTITPVGPGNVHPDAALSDQVSPAGAPTAHDMVPGYAFSGQTTLDGLAGSKPLFRVVVATDDQCVNVVYQGSVVGSPAYAPRITGPLKLPGAQTGSSGPSGPSGASGASGATGPSGASGASGPSGPTGPGFQPDASQKDLLLDASGVPFDTSEEIAPAAEAAALSGASGPSGVSGPTGASGPGGSAGLPAEFAVPQIAPIDLWDNGWPTDRYYWTVVPVQQVSTYVDSTLKLQYADLESAQDECAAGHVAAFGKVAKPVVASDAKPYALGLSPTGDLANADGADPKFYGAALVAWQPVSGATGYEVQWSKSLYPWKTEGKPILTAATSAPLTGLEPGTWYYRVRGLDPYLPGPLQKLGWSQAVQIEIAPASFAIEPGSTSSVKKKTVAAPRVALPTGYASVRSYSRAFSLALPKGWKVLPKNHPLVASLLKGQVGGGYTLELVSYDPKGVRNGYATDCVVLKGAGRGTAAFPDWVKAQIAGIRSSLNGAPFTRRLLQLPAGRALRVGYVVAPKGTRIWALTYLVDAVDTSYALSCSTVPALQKRYRPVFDRAAKTFSLTG